jgi:acyl-CoA oxidase
MRQELEQKGDTHSKKMSELQRLFDNWNPELRDRILKELHSDPIYKRNYYLSIEQYRRTVVEILKKLVALKLFSIYDYQNDPLKFLTFLRTIGHVDYSTSIKAGVHFTLCGGSILALGTKKHYKIASFFKG